MLAGCLLLLVIVAGFAPQILLHSPFVDRLVRRATGDLQGEITLGRWGGSWFTPLTVQDVQAVDAVGNKLLEIRRLRTESTLLALVIRGFSDLQLAVEQPRVFLTFDGDTSNWEQALESWLAASGQPSRLSGAIHIEDGSLLAHDVTSGGQWSVGGIQGELRLAAGHADLNLDAASVASGESAGKANVVYSGGDQKQLLQLQVADFSLDVAAPIVRRFDPQLTTAGFATGRAEIEWGTSQSLRCENLTIRDFAVAGSQWLRDERLQLPLLLVSGGVVADGEGWRAENLQVESEMLNLRASGEGRFPLLREIATGQLKLTSEIDVARVAHALPMTLRLRSGRQITSGILSVNLQSTREGAGVRWTGRVNAEQLAAVDGGQTFSWDDPLQVRFAASHAEGAWLLEDLTCRGSFVQLAARGTVEQGELSFESDLGQLAADAGRFFDLAEADLSGQIDGSATWQQSAEGRIAFSAKVATRDFQWAQPGGKLWREPTLQVTLHGQALTSQHQLTEIGAAEASLEAGGDRLQAALTAPLPLNGSPAVQLRAQLHGRLETWLPRCQFFVPAIQPTCNGQIELNTDLALDGAQVEIASLDARFQQLSGRIAGLQLDEPQLQIQAAGTWDRSAMQAVLPQLSCASSALAFRAEQVQLDAQSSLAIRGRLGYRADLERIARWFQVQDVRLRGELVGQAELLSDGSQTVIRGDAEAHRFVYERAPQRTRPGVAAASRGADWQTVWAEDRVRIVTDAALDRRQSHASLKRFEISSAALSLAASGEAHDLAGRCELQLNGQVTYDLQQLTTRLQPQSKIDVQMTGISTQPFSFQGPLRSGPTALVSRAGLRGETAEHPSIWTQRSAAGKLAWETAQIYGVPFEAAMIDARLRDGRMTLEPVNVKVSGGQIEITPSVDFRSDPAMLTIPSGKIVDRVQITRDMCHTWLKYVAPLVADATAVDGELSMSIQESTIPLDAVLQGPFQGTLEVHAARVGPGELSAQLLTLAEQIKGLLRRQPPRSISAKWVQLPAQRITVRAQENRVHHEGLQFVVDDVLVTTSGSVGLDQSITLLATVPIADEWVARDRWLSSLRGQTLQIPISGTLSQPRLDSRAVDQMARRLAEGAAGRLLEQELGRGLERLFGPRD